MFPSFFLRQDGTGLEVTSQIAGMGRDYICLVLLLWTIREKFRKNLGWDRTTQYHSENFWMVLKWTKIQDFPWNSVLDKKFLAQYCFFLKKQDQLIKSGIPISFLGLRRDRKWVSLEWRELDRMESGPVLNARDWQFPTFSVKKISYPKTRLGMQTSIT